MSTPLSLSADKRGRVRHSGRTNIERRAFATDYAGPGALPWPGLLWYQLQVFASFPFVTS